ncbi:MAG: hypothetical protein ABII23_08800 [bacterium]
MHIKLFSSKSFYLYLPAVLICSYFAGQIVFCNSDPDVFWHLKNGERLIHEGIFPVQDVFSFTGHGKFLVAYEWLSEAVFYMLFASIGYGGLFGLTLMLFGGTIYVAYTHMRTIGLDSKLSIFLSLLVLVGFLRHMSIRTQNFSFLFFIIFVYLIKGRYYAKLWMKLLVLILLMIWAQLHGGFILGLILIFVEALNESVIKRELSLKILLFPLLACFAVGIHPSGYYSLVYPLWMFFQRPPVCSFIDEWKPIDFSKACNYPYICIISIIVYFGLKKISHNIMWTAFWFVLLFFSMGNLKMMPYTITLGVILLAYRLKEEKKYSIPLVYVIILNVVLCAFSANQSLLLIKDHHQFQKPFIERSFPHEEADFIKKYLPSKFIFNSYGWGGYLIYKLYPSNLIFIDGRADLYWQILANEYVQILESRADNLSLLDEFKIDVVVLPKHYWLNRELYIAPGWVLAFEGSMAYVFARKTPVK